MHLKTAAKKLTWTHKNKLLMCICKSQFYKKFYSAAHYLVMEVVNRLHHITNSNSISRRQKALLATHLYNSKILGNDFKWLARLFLGDIKLSLLSFIFFPFRAGLENFKAVDVVVPIENIKIHVMGLPESLRNVNQRFPHSDPGCCRFHPELIIILRGYWVTLGQLGRSPRAIPHLDI